VAERIWMQRAVRASSDAMAVEVVAAEAPEVQGSQEVQ